MPDRILFASNWGPLIIFFVLMALVSFIAFIRKDIISEGAIFLVQTRWPFVSVQNNQVKDYDLHEDDFVIQEMVYFATPC